MLGTYHKKNSRQSFCLVNSYFYLKRRRLSPFDRYIASYLTYDLNLSWLCKLWCKIHSRFFENVEKKKNTTEVFFFFVSRYIKKTKTHKMMQEH